MKNLEFDIDGLEVINKNELQSIDGGGNAATILGGLTRIFIAGGDDPRNPNLPGNKM